MKQVAGREVGTAIGATSRSISCRWVFGPGYTIVLRRMANSAAESEFVFCQICIFAGKSWHNSNSERGVRMRLQLINGSRSRLRGLLFFSLAVMVSLSTVPLSEARTLHSSVRCLKRQNAGRHKLFGRKQSAIEGIVIETENGEPLQAINADILFNPASTLKLATALMALQQLGPEFRFHTRILRDQIFKDGIVTEDTVENGELLGNLYVDSDDLTFDADGAAELARELNSQGIYSVRGKLIVSPGFYMNVTASGQQAAKQLAGVLCPYARKHHPVAADLPRVKIRGGFGVGYPPSDTREIANCSSVSLKDVLKATLCHSNNYMADHLGNYLAHRVSPQSASSGPKALQDFLVSYLQLPRDEASFSSTSGLYKNRITPRAEMKVLRALKDVLANNPLAPGQHLTLADILPVAGIDPGTLHGRFKQEPGTVVAKTGTLTDTDAGVAALVGEVRTALGGTIMFVIFEQGMGRGAIPAERARQDEIVSQIQRTYGGAVTIDYEQQPLRCRYVR